MFAFGVKMFLGCRGLTDDDGRVLSLPSECSSLSFSISASLLFSSLIGLEAADERLARERDAGAGVDTDVDFGLLGVISAEGAAETRSSKCGSPKIIRSYGGFRCRALWYFCPMRSVRA